MSLEIQPSAEPRFDLTFDHSYEVSLAELSGTGYPSPLYFPGGSKIGGRHSDGILLGFTTQQGQRWLGLFAFGMLGGNLSVVCSAPHPDWACVVAKGAGYWINVNTQECREVPLIPIRDIRVLPLEQILLISSFTDVAALGAKKILWRYRVCWDDLKISEIKDGKVLGTGFDPTNKQQSETEFSVDLRTGRVLTSAYF